MACITKKKKYRTLEEAQSDLYWLWKRYGFSKAYTCNHCGHYHLTTRNFGFAVQRIEPIKKEAL